MPTLILNVQLFFLSKVSQINIRHPVSSATHAADVIDNSTMRQDGVCYEVPLAGGQRQWCGIGLKSIQGKECGRQTSHPS